MSDSVRPLDLRSCAVGPWPMNAYAAVCPVTSESVLIDPGCEPEALARLLTGTDPIAILLTHTHPDHVSALDSMRDQLKVPVYVGPGPHFGDIDVAAERVLADGDLIAVGQGAMRVYHAPGHTADQVCLAVEDGTGIVVGDTVFDGGPGKTWSEAGFETTLRTLRDVVLAWPDESVCYPGHGKPFRLGERRADIEAFLAKDHGPFFGDATWGL